MSSEEIWKDIPIDELYGYQISSHGNLRQNSTLTPIYKISPIRIKKSNRSIHGYKAITVYNNQLKSKDYLIHRLVCITFINIPEDLSKTNCFKFVDGYQYIVNHKNGNSLDNQKENLEWSTITINNNHALDTNLRTECVKVHVIDHMTNNIIEFRSVNKLSKFLNVEHKKCYQIISNHSCVLFRERYTFKLENIDIFKNTICKEKIDVIFYDYVNDQITITSSISEASFITGINSSVIKHRLKESSDKPIAGFVFRKLRNFNNEWPFLDKEKAAYQRKFYFENAISDRINSSGIIIKTINVLTNEIKEFGSIYDAANYHGVLYHNVKNLINKNKNPSLRIYNNIIYKKLDDPRDPKDAVIINIKIRNKRHYV